MEEEENTMYYCDELLKCIKLCLVSWVGFMFWGFLSIYQKLLGVNVSLILEIGKDLNINIKYMGVVK